MIEIKNVKKSFGDIEAVKELSAEIREGQVYGLVGTNGAGKSTLLRMISGVYAPDAGDILIDSIRKEFRRFAFHASRETEFKLAELGNHAGIYGGVRMILE